jgi:hypothetical protein
LGGGVTTVVPPGVVVVEGCCGTTTVVFGGGLLLYEKQLASAMGKKSARNRNRCIEASLFLQMIAMARAGLAGFVTLMCRPPSFCGVLRASPAAHPLNGQQMRFLTTLRFVCQEGNEEERRRATIMISGTPQSARGAPLLEARIASTRDEPFLPCVARRINP